MITENQFRDAAGLTDGKAKQWYEPFTKAYKQYFVYNPLVMAHILAQVGHESSSFTTLEEGMYYRSSDRIIQVFGSRNGLTAKKAHQLVGNPQALANFVYGGDWGRKHLGNTQPNDGWHFRGGGLIQLTGRANYKAASDGLGIDMVRLPDLVRKDEDIASQAAMWWLWDKGLLKFFEADDLEGATRRINGGLNGLADRRKRLDRAKAVLMV